MLKGSYTVEAALIVSFFLLVMAAAMKTGLSLYQEVCQTSEPAAVESLWEVEDFYKYYLVKESIKEAGKNGS